MGDVPVYNVSLSLLQRAFPEEPPFRVIELAVGGGEREADEAVPGVTPLRRATDQRSHG